MRLWWRRLLLPAGRPQVSLALATLLAVWSEVIELVVGWEVAGIVVGVLVAVCRGTA